MTPDILVSFNFFIDPRGTVVDIIEQWRPRQCTTEKDFKKSLILELRSKLEGKKIIGEYGSGTQKIDIVVQDRVPIELKKDLKSTADLHRTMGQIEQYLTKWDFLILVLCGDVKKQNMDALEEYASKKYDYLNTFHHSKIHIITK